MTELAVHAGGEQAAMGARFIDAWRRAERGEDFAERHLSFDTFETMTRVLTAPIAATLAVTLDVPKNLDLGDWHRTSGC